MTPLARSIYGAPKPYVYLPVSQFIVELYLYPLMVPSPLSVFAAKHSKTVVCAVRSSVEPPPTGEQVTEMIGPLIVPLSA